MRVFVTGATGFVGFAVAQELIAAGHKVLGLTRSDEGALALQAIGAEAHSGGLDDLDSLRTATAASDGVIHCAFDHDFTRFAASCELDRQAIETIGKELAGTGRPFVVTSGISALAPGRTATEDDMPAPPTAAYPRVSERTALQVADLGVPTSVVRLPQVHDPVKQGFVTYLILAARQKGVSAYIEEGANRWAAVHRADAARLYRLALEKAAPLARYNTVGEEGVPLREIAEAIGRGLNIPVRSISKEEAAAHFGFLGGFAGLDMPASSALTQQRLGWTPAGPSLIEDLTAMNYER